MNLLYNVRTVFIKLITNSFHFFREFFFGFNVLFDKRLNPLKKLIFH
jgi:hypothetical protein